MRVSFILPAVMLAAAACASAQPLAEAGAWPASYPEGPLWQDGKLYYAEMGAERISVLENGVPHLFFEQRGCGPTALAPYGEGFLVLCHIGARVVAVNAQGQVLRTWDRDDEGARLRDPNDVSADGEGGAYFSDPGLFARASAPSGYVMHLTASGELRRVAGPLWYPNGVFVDRAARRLYVTEHMTGRVLRFAIGADGALSDREVFADIDDTRRPRRYRKRYAETGPDGLEIGPQGELFVAIYGEGRLLRFAPDGHMAGMIDTPTRYLTNLAFDDQGGAYVTGSTENLRPPFPGEVRYFSAAALTQAPP